MRRAGEVVQPVSRSTRSPISTPSMCAPTSPRRSWRRCSLGSDAGARRRWTPAALADAAGTVSWVSSQAEFTPTPIQTREERADLVYAVKIRVANSDGVLKIGMPVGRSLSCDGARAMTDAVVVRGHRASASARRPALVGVSCCVRSGELFGFIGPDGAGKTTLFRILVTLLVPDAGSARCSATTSYASLWTLRQRVGYMPGRFSLYPDLSVEENLRFFASVFGTTIEREHERIAPIYTQLEPFKDAPRRRAVRRHEAEARALLRARPSPRHPLSRRADDRRRRRVAPRVLGSARPG